MAKRAGGQPYLMHYDQTAEDAIETFWFNAGRFSVFPSWMTTRQKQTVLDFLDGKNENKNNE